MHEIVTRAEIRENPSHALDDDKSKQKMQNNFNIVNACKGFAHTNVVFESCILFFLCVKLRA